MEWLAIVPFGVFALVVYLVIRSIRRDPRWLGNAYLLAVAVLAALAAVSVFGGIGAMIVAFLAVAGLLSFPFLLLALIIFLIANGVVTIRREGLRLANALSLLLGLGLAVAVVAFFTGIGQGTVWLAAGAVWLFLFCAWVGFILLCFVVYGFVYQRVVRGRPVDYVVVLGSGLKSDGTVTRLLAQRVERGLQVQQAQAARGQRVPIIMSGGKGDDEVRSEAAAMADYAISRGADPALVITEDASVNTEQNLRNSGELVLASRMVPAEGRGMIVSSNFHALRAAALARRLGLAMQATGAPVALYYWPSAILREWIAVLKPRWRGHAIAAALVTLPLPLVLLFAAG